mgnify:CR=1 FL=1
MIEGHTLAVQDNGTLLFFNRFCSSCELIRIVVVKLLHDFRVKERLQLTGHTLRGTRLQPVAVEYDVARTFRTNKDELPSPWIEAGSPRPTSLMILKSPETFSPN